jgi:predicted DNA-binding transcriptional regulator YafY
MARNDQLIRQHRLLQILERNRYGYTLEELAAELTQELGLTDLSTRSVRRDLNALQSAGFDLKTDIKGDDRTASRKVWKLGPRFRNPLKITVSATELLALSMGRDLLLPLAGTPYWSAIEAFWNNLRSVLPEAVWDHYAESRRLLSVRGIPVKSYAKHEGMLTGLQRAIQQHRVTEIEYQSLGKTATTRRIEPYGIIFYHPSIYVVAGLPDAPPGTARIRHLKLDRFKKATVLDERFTPPENFDLADHFRASLGIFSSEDAKTYKIRVSAYAAPWVREDPWHPDQKIVDKPDGSLELSVPAAHDMDIIPKLLALGPEAELLSPKESRQAVAEMVRRMNAAYGK